MTKSPTCTSCRNVDRHVVVTTPSVLLEALTGRIFLSQHAAMLALAPPPRAVA